MCFVLRIRDNLFKEIEKKEENRKIKKSLKEVFCSCSNDKPGLDRSVRCEDETCRGSLLKREVKKF